MWLFATMILVLLKVLHKGFSTPQKTERIFTAMQKVLANGNHC
jgi:hypothetical protein